MSDLTKSVESFIYRSESTNRYLTPATVRNFNALIFENETLEKENKLLREDNVILRRMLCLSYAEHPYTDDGELQDNRWPMIDFKRDSIEMIQNKMNERLVEALASKHLKDS